MSEQEFPVPEVPSERPRGSKLWILIILAIVVIGAGAYYAMATMRAARWDAAQYIPQDVAAAVTVDLRMTSQKLEAREHILDICKNAGLEDPEGKLIESINKGLKLDVEEDVLKHLNRRAGLAVVAELNGFMPSVVAVLGAKNDGSAEKLMEVVAKKLAENKIEFEERKYKDYKFLHLPDPTGSAKDANPAMPGMAVSLYVGAVKDSIVITNGDSGFKKVVQTVEGEPSLGDDEHFAHLRQTDDSTIAGTYWSGAKFFKMIEPFFSMAAMQAPEVAESYKRSLQAQIAAVGTISASGHGIKMVVKGVNAESSGTAVETDVEELVSVAPKDAALVVATGDLTKSWEVAKEELKNDPSIRTQLDEMLGGVMTELGVDLFEDILFPIKTLGMYYTPGTALDPDVEFPGRVTLVSKIDNPNAFSASVDKVKKALAAVPDVEIEDTQLGGQKTAVFAMGESKFSPDIDVQGGGVVGDPDSDVSTSENQKIYLYETIIGDTLVLTMTGPDAENEAQAAVDMFKNKGASVATTESFAYTKKHLPDKTQVLMYWDTAAMTKLFESEMEEDDKKILNAILDGSGTIACFGDYQEKEYEVTAVLPFKK